MPKAEKRKSAEILGQSEFHVRAPLHILKAKAYCYKTSNPCNPGQNEVQTMFSS